MTAHQIALDWHNAIRSYDAGLFGIEQLSRTVRDLWDLADSLGLRDEVNNEYELLRSQ